MNFFFYLEPNYIPFYYPFQTTGKYIQRYYGRPMMMDMAEPMMKSARPAPAMAGRAAGPSGPGATLEFEMRTEFPETWIWKTLNTESE
jgi:hypothetical protein